MNYFPSAIEMESDVVSIDITQSQTLQTVAELSLYIVQLHKRIEVLEKVVAEKK